MKIMLLHFIIDNPIIPITMNYDVSFCLIRQMECIPVLVYQSLRKQRFMCSKPLPFSIEYRFRDNMPHD